MSRLASWLGRVHGAAVLVAAGPSLDKDPVLWREWRRSRPSRLAIDRLGSFHCALSLAGMAVGIVTIADDYASGSEFLMLVSGLHATFGLLLVSLFAPTVLAEERVRGSLDVLMTTPAADGPHRPVQMVGCVSRRPGPGDPAGDKRA